MTYDFSSIHNHLERPVYDAVLTLHARYPQIDDHLLPDVACVALNRLPSRYIRHQVDLAFFLSETERAANEQSIEAAVSYAFEFVQARHAMRARS